MFISDPDGRRDSIYIRNRRKKAKLVYLPEETPLKYLDGVGFSNKVGDGINIKEFGFITSGGKDNKDEDRIIRGLFTPYIAASGENVEALAGHLCDIRVPHQYDFASGDRDYKQDFVVRGNDNSEFYAVTPKIKLSSNPITVCRGDCFVTTATVRMHRNFIDQDAPISDKIVNPTA